MEQRIQRRVAAKRGPTGDHLIQNRPQRVDIGRGTDLFARAADLFGSHIARRAHEGAAARLLALGIDVLGQAKVRDLGDAVFP